LGKILLSISHQGKGFNDYLLDTNICIYIIKKSPEKFLKKLESIATDEGKNEIYLSSVTISELYYGVEKSSQSEKNIEALKGFLTPFQIINFDHSAW
jgi:tRNA(fMet)-specific endonuclease VapC